MPFHNGKFLLSQLAGLCQNFLRNQQFPDIMQACRHANYIYIIRIQRIAVRPLHQTVQQKPRHTAYAGHVHPLFPAAQPQGIAQNRYHNLVAFFSAEKPIRNHVHQLMLFGMQQDCVDDAAANDAGYKGTADVVRCTQFKCTVDVGIAGFRGNHDGGDILNPMSAVHFLQNLKSVHLRHHNIQQQCGNLRAIALQRNDDFLPICCFNHFKFLIQYICKNCAVHFRIVCNQQFSSSHKAILSCRSVFCISSSAANSA